MPYEMIDLACAETLGVGIEVYIEKIEKTTYKRAELIIMVLWSSVLQVVLVAD